MYMGFMNLGLSLMSIFGFVLMVTALLNIGPFVFAAIVIWFYCFFHARNFAVMEQEELENQSDDFILFKGRVQSDFMKELLKNRKVFSWILMIIGIWMLWKGVFRIFFSFIPGRYEYLFWGYDDVLMRLFLGAILVYWGVKLIRNKKQELVDNSENEESKQEFDEVMVSQELENTEQIQEPEPLHKPDSETVNEIEMK